MQKKWLAVALVSALVCSAATAVQAEVKIGVVSTEVILRDSAAAQAASKKLEQEFSKRDKELNAAGQRLKRRRALRKERRHNDGTGKNSQAA